MKPGAIVAATGLLLGTVWGAAPAQAAEALDCELGQAPPITSVQSGPGGTDIYVGNVPSDATAYASWVAAYVTCLEGGRVAYWVECVGDYVPSGSPVTIDIENLHIHIDPILPDGQSTLCDD